MARPLRTGGKTGRNTSAAKGRKTTKTKARIAPAATRVKRRSISEDLKEAREQQAATAEILKVIASSPDDVQPVFDAIARCAKRLIGGFSTAVHRIIEDIDHLVAFTPTNAASDAALEAAFPRPLSKVPAIALGVRNGATAQVSDSETADAGIRELGRARGWRSATYTPLMDRGTFIGFIVSTRRETGMLADHHVQLLRTFADQAVIAIKNVGLFNEVQARTEDLSETLQQQTATADVLKVISRSAFDLETVLSTLTESAAHLCEADMGAITRQHPDGGYHHATRYNFSPEWEQSITPIRLYPDRGSLVGRVLLTGQSVQIPDVQADAEYAYPEHQRVGGYRTLLGVPLLRSGQPTGVLFLGRKTVQPFTDRQVELVQTFADQAVIAIENVRLFDEVQATSRDLSEALTYQTGSSNILRVIASSPTDVKPVLQAIVESACELCGAYDAIVRLKDGDDLTFGAHHGPLPVSLERVPISAGSMGGLAMTERKPVHVHDIRSPEGDALPFTRELARRYDTRTLLVLPLMRENESIGVILLRRAEVKPFTEKQIALLQTFADQAVIAIENVRLFNETKEALERQTATAEILKVISSSVADTTPVFEQILDSCERLAAFNRMAIFLLGEDGQVHIGAYRGGEGDALKATFPQPLANTPMSLAFERQQALFFGDVLNNPDAPPSLRIAASRVGSFSVLVAPLLWEGRGIGAFHIARDADATFSDREVVLLKTFADQAAIAIQNARLFNETKEALESQTATADILKVIASSPDDVQPVFQAIAERSNRLVNGLSTTVLSVDDDTIRLSAFTRTNSAADAALIASFPRKLSEQSFGDSISKGDIFRLPDTEADPGLRDLARLRGYRSMLFVPLLHDGALIGAIGQTRVEPGPFAENHVQLLKTFADQAVIAISNVGLFKEVEERTNELSQSLNDLRTAQDRLVQTEKLASLGQLTAGIAHEIKNPLNFVNNFSALSAELVDELDETLAPAPLDQKMRGDVGELTAMLKSNLEKVVQHGKRADSIVKNMLLHSREGSGEHRSADINALVEESLNLAYHGARAEKPGFNIILERDLDPDAGAVELYPQEITRALLNLISNGFYAASQRKSVEGESFGPVLSVATKNRGKTVEIRIRDNGTGIPDEVKAKIFNPFFTTKPSGEGTGLGLSMSHDIIVKQHGGTIGAETEPGLFTEFKIVLPRTSQR